MMALLVTEYMKYITEVDEEIKQLDVQNKLLCSHPLYSIKDKELSEPPEQFIAELIKKKEQQFARDKIAFVINHPNGLNRIPDVLWPGDRKYKNLEPLMNKRLQKMF